MMKLLLEPLTPLFDTVLTREVVTRPNIGLLQEELAAAFGEAYVSAYQSGEGYLPDGLTLVTVMLNQPPGNADTIVDATLAAHNPAGQSAAQLAAEQLAADREAMIQAQADAAIMDINAELVTLNAGLVVLQADYAGWDAMSTTEKINASKRMLNGVITLGQTMIATLQRQRKIIKFVRWL